MGLNITIITEVQMYQAEHTSTWHLQKIHSQHQQESQQQRGKLCGL